MSAHPSDPEHHRDTGSISESGGRLYSLDGVIERTELAFLAETRPEVLRDLIDEADQRTLLREITDYVLITTGIRLSRTEYLQAIGALHALLFRLGVLDPYLRDESICDMAIDGTGAVSVRQFGEAWRDVPERFLDQDQVKRLIERLAIRANVPFGRDSTSLTEIGATFFERPARLSVTAPPISRAIEVTIRVHPTIPPTLDSLVADGVLSEIAAETIRQAVIDHRGLLIAGEPEAGKTTFIQALLPLLPSADRQILIERAGELRPVSAGDNPDQPVVTRFGAPDLGEPITKAMDHIGESSGSTWLIVDEVRADEAVDWWSLLTVPHSIIPIWAFRSSSNPQRVRTALNILLRQVQLALPQGEIDTALRDRLPVVVLLGHHGPRIGKPRVLALGQWILTGDGTLTLSVTPD